MVDKLNKALLKLSAKELATVQQIIERLQSGDVTGLDLKQLKGNDEIFRVRKGRLRIIYTKNNQNDIRLLLVSKRSEKTYRDF